MVYPRDNLSYEMNFPRGRKYFQDGVAFSRVKLFGGIYLQTHHFTLYIARYIETDTIPHDRMNSKFTTPHDTKSLIVIMNQITTSHYIERRLLNQITI